jgi:nucleotide-binding universal stress UspA family protein
VNTAAPIVAGVDFSDASRHALGAAVGLARQIGAPLHLVSAVEPLLAEAAKQRHQLAAFIDQVTGEMRQFAAGAAPGGLAVSYEAVIGEPAEELAAAAARAGARLIVVGTRGRGEAARMLLGSTTRRLLEIADRPVLVTDAADHAGGGSAPEWSDVTRVVCGVDFSDGSAAALDEARRFAAALHAPLFLVHAIDTDASTAEAERRLAALPGAQPSGHIVRAGSAPEVLAEVAAEATGAVIVVGASGAMRQRPGTTALDVLRSANAPVLAVP